MQQSCTYGSVRGVPGNRRSYRDNPDINFQRIRIARRGPDHHEPAEKCRPTLAPDGERARTSRVADRRGWVRRSGTPAPADPSARRRR